MGAPLDRDGLTTVCLAAGAKPGWVSMGGSRHHEEDWIPAEELAAFNDAVVGAIEVVRSFAAVAK